jgi:serine/threonine protein kinase
MSAPSFDPVRPRPLSREAAEALAAQLVEEMIQQWRQGERPLAEDFLARHPELWDHPEAAADLIYEEICLRQEHGRQVPVEQVLRRFPQWQTQLEVLLDCQRVLGPRRAAPQFPAAGQLLGDFLLLAELGRGIQGPVFLASQLSLGDRPVVLKLTPCEAHEHLSLARLQHTHIVPLYSVQDHPDRGLRALCMPYFGGATLDRLLDALRPQPLAQRTGQDFLDALERVQGATPLVAPVRRQARQALAGASYVQVVCWLGACLADALQYAHDRGLVHLDLKPSNVLLAADGQPMLLDFHLARGPLQPDGEGASWLGGTPGYMSPEQYVALRAIQQGREVPRVVDGRSDLYSLGVVLYEALGGDLPRTGWSLRTATTTQGGKLAAEEARTLSGEELPPLHRCNAQVSVGLEDILRKCLAGDPNRRYPHMAALAADLRRHLADLPLAGARNRSLVERWQKWRRRRPHGVALVGMMLAVLTAASAVALVAASHFMQRAEQARTALNDAQVQMALGQWEGAVRTLRHGHAIVQGLPWQGELAENLEHRLRQAEQGRIAADRAGAVRELHQLADRVRFLYGADHLAPEALQGLEGCCRTFWKDRERVVERLRTAGGAALEAAARDDLLDLAIFWADLQIHLTPPASKEAARRQALTVLAQAEALLGPSPVLDEERVLHDASGRSAGRSVRVPETAWEHYALSRALLRSGDLERAAEEAERAVRLQPQGLWPNFYQGLCAFRRGRYADAITAYSVCIGAAPQAAPCFSNRAAAFAALGRNEQALRDYDQALRLDPTLTVAARNRALLHNCAKR